MRLLILIIVVAALSCTSEIEYPHRFPIVLTDGATNISSTGATFSARIETGRENIISYGFEWAGVDGQNVSGKVETTGTPADDSFSYNATRDIAPGSNSLKAFVKTSTLTIYGNVTQFISEGSAPPAIASFSPSQAVDGTEITLSMNNFAYIPGKTEVRIGTTILPIVSGSDALVVVKLPPSTLAGRYFITLKSQGRAAVSSTLFTVIAPFITGIPKDHGRVGERITVTGEFFDSTPDVYAGFKSLTYGDYYLAQVRVLSSTQMDIYVPDASNIQGNLLVSSQFAGSPQKEAIYNRTFTVMNSWNKINSTTAVENPGGNSAVTIGGIIYVIGMGKLYSYNPATNEWLQKASFPGVKRTFGVAFSYGDKLYYGFGKKEPAPGYLKDIWMYDPSNNQWTSVMDAPITPRMLPIAMPLGDDVYIGFGFSDDNPTLTNTYFNDLWRFNPLNKSWTQSTTPFSGSFISNCSSFVLDGKGYVYHPSRGFWQFNPTGLQWTQKATQAIPFYNNNPAIAAGSTGIIFSGTSEGSANKVFQYYPSQDLWIQRQRVPDLARANEIAAFVNGKVYYLLGITPGRVSKPEFWELTLED